MYTNNKLSKAVRLAIAFGAASTMAFTASVNAAEEDETAKVERIQVTGSSIKRTDFEGALPVQVISREQIDATGITSAAELIQSLPSMQGFTTSGDSVGGGGGGALTASLRNLGASYTLVLVNGQRLAPRGSGSTIDLSGIPLAAVERVEVLTDGASSLYGSDAIAGVVNFILKSDMQGVNLNVRYNKPQETGGSEYSASVTAGFGDRFKDGFNILFSLSHDDKEQLAAKDRDFSATGVIPFTLNGTDYTFFNGSGNAIPANATVRYIDANGETKQRVFNPYREQNGQCAENNVPIGTECQFDYTATLEILPESTRDSFFVQGVLDVTDNLEAYSSVSLSKFSQTSRIAPYPTGNFIVPLDSDLVRDYVLPHLTPEELAGVNRVTSAWRALPAGNRTTEFETVSTQFVLGARGELAGFDFNGAYTYGKNDTDQNYPTGWLLADEFRAVIASGAVNIYVPPSELDAGSAAALAPTIYSGHWNNDKTTLNAFNFNMSKAVMELPAGQMYLGLGGDYRITDYKNTIAEANRNQDILFLAPGTDYDLKRNASGAFAELIVPVMDNFELTGAVRYDSIGAVKNQATGDTVNESEAETTYKLNGRYEFSDALLFRASIGTGFKAPSMVQIARPQVPFGVTSGNYTCPFTAPDPLAAFCLPGQFQAGVFRQGNSQLKSELSEQMSVGFVYAPSRDFSVSVDYWKVDIEDYVQGLTEAQLFAEPEKYRHLFTSRENLSTGEQELAIILSDGNVGLARNRGVDWNITVGHDLSFGRFATSIQGTYMIKNDYSRPGTNPSDNDFLTSLGRFGDDNAVAFRNLVRISNTLTHGDFSHAFNISYKSGYMDQVQEPGPWAVDFGVCPVKVGSATGPCATTNIQLRVPSYVKADYQLAYNATDELKVTFGVNNMFDKQPPLSIRNAGAGHQLGFDPRYYDAYGRTFYIGADYQF